MREAVLHTHTHTHTHTHNPTRRTAENAVKKEKKGRGKDERASSGTALSPVCARDFVGPLKIMHLARARQFVDPLKIYNKIYTYEYVYMYMYMYIWCICICL